MNSPKDPSKKGQINIELDDTVAEGTYSNLAIINHSVSEFVVDFFKHHAWDAKKQSEVTYYTDSTTCKTSCKSLT